VLLLTILLASLIANLVFIWHGRLDGFVDDSNTAPSEHLYSGKSSARDKIAIIKMDGVIMEGSLGFVHKQIDQAAEDSHVKAIVLRINSPGGSITASDDLYRRLQELHDGSNIHQKGGKKPIVVSMGSLAASGGYYISMPADYLIAETTTITGSIGVYAAFPNIADFANEHGIGMNIIKAGAIKDSGSMFKEMSPQERQLWQVMVDSAYDRFLEVIKKGRQGADGKSKLKYDPTAVAIREDLPLRDANGKPVRDENGKDKTFEYVRRIADGGIYTAKQAKDLGLIDEIGYLHTAIDKAQSMAGLETFKVITYERPPSLASLLLGVKAGPANPLSPQKLAAGATPRLWYLAPQSELAGIFAAMGQE
jgi:protease-4